MSANANLHPDALAAMERLRSHPGDPQVALETARVLMALQQFDMAAQLWQQLAVALPDSLEAPLCFAACAISVGQIDAGRELAARFAPVLSRLAPHERARLARTADQLYLLAGTHFKFANQRAAEAILDLLLPYEPYGRQLLGIDPPASRVGPTPDRLDDATVAAFIRERIADVAEGRAVPPARGANTRAYYEAAFEPFRGKRTLIVHREHYYPGRKGALHPAARYMAESAAEAGLEPLLVPSNVTIGGADADAIDPGGRARVLEAVNQWRPDIVVYENLGANPAMLDALSAARARQGFKLIGLQHDIWLKTISASARQAAAVADAIWHFEPTDTPGADATPANVVGTAPPMPRGLFVAARNASTGTPPNDICFMGSINQYNYIRSVWLIEATRLGIPIAVQAGYPFVDERYATQESFAEFLVAAKTSLCITGRTTQQDAVPGRVWEGILAGSVTIEDGGRKIRHYLTPFAHYIPVSTIDELEFYVGFFARNEDMRRAVADGALTFVDNYYSVARSWYAPLAVAYGPPAAVGSAAALEAVAG